MPASPIPAVALGRGVVVVGVGLVGMATAWLLSRQGLAVQLIDGRPGLDGNTDLFGQSLSGSEAALGVLMAGVFHRSSGRAWSLRQRSQALWRQWRQELAARGRPLPWREGLLLLAASEEELQRQRILLEDPRRPQGCLRALSQEDLEPLWPHLPEGALGGLHSSLDGQLDPQPALEILRSDALEAGLEILPGWAESLERNGQGWSLRLAGGARLQSEVVVIAAGLASIDLVPEGLRPPLPALQPVLGQALELECPLVISAAMAGTGRHETCNWPGAVSWKGINLIPRPVQPSVDPAATLESSFRIWLGATLEPGEEASPEALERIRTLEGDAPNWLRQAREIRRWQGLRARPDGQAAPLHLDLGDGLLLAAGHYRNGVLLAPASAEWVLERISASAVGAGP